MLRALRRKMKGILWLTIIIIIPSFVVFYGFSRMRSSRNSPRYAGKIYGRKIPTERFRQLYIWYRTWAIIRYGERFPQAEKQLNLEEDVWTHLLLLAEAKQQRVDVNDSELAKQIKGILGIFSQNKKIGTNFYQLVVSEVFRTDIPTFEQTIREQLMIEKLKTMISRQVMVTEEEIKEAYIQRKNKVKASYVYFDPSLYEAEVSLSDSDLQEYFEAHKEEFRYPEKVNAEYVVCKLEELEKEIIVGEDEISSYYNTHQEEFKEPEKVRARHILFKLTPDASPESVATIEKQAEEILKLAQEGNDFAGLAKKYSEDEGTREKGGDLGFFTRGRMVPPFEEAAFALGAGEISKELVKTRFGYHIIKVDEKELATVHTLNEVKEQIRSSLVKEKAAEQAEEKLVDLLIAIDEGANWQKLMAESNIPVRETGLFAANEEIPTIGWSGEFSRAAFELPLDTVSDIVKTVSAYYLIRVKEKTPSHLPEAMIEVKDKVSEKVKKVKAREKSRERAEEFLARLQEGKNLEETAKEYGMEVKTTEPFPRQSYIKEIGYEVAFNEAAFNLEPGEITKQVIEGTRGYYLLRLEEKIPAPEEQFAAEKENLEKSLLQQKQNKLLQEWYNQLKEKAELTIFPL